MATTESTLQVIKQFLDYEDLRHQVSDRGDGDKVIIFGFGDNDITIGVMILIEENGEFVQFRCVKMFEGEEILNTKYKIELYEYLLLQNYKKKLGTWCLDPSDGDFYMGINIPIESGELQVSQIKRIWRTISNSMVDTYKEIKSVLETGKLSTGDGSDSEPDLDALLKMLSEAKSGI